VAVAEEIVRVALARGVGDNLYGCGRGGNSCGCGRGGISCGCGRKVNCLAAAGTVQQFAWLWQGRQFVCGRGGAVVCVGMWQGRQFVSLWQKAGRVCNSLQSSTLQLCYTYVATGGCHCQAQLTTI
jgi:hypothetical protein